MPLQATSGAASYDAFGGGVAAVPNYIEDVFSTYLYTGTGSAQTITNGIDLSTKGGMVWEKTRTTPGFSPDHMLFDTSRGPLYPLYSNTNTAPGQYGSTLTAFNTTGFTVGGNLSQSGVSHASWTFRKQPKFFDVVTYTGNGANRTISHALGSTPGCIFVKRTDLAGDWYVYHSGYGGTGYYLLNSTAAPSSDSTIWNDTNPTSTVFSVGTGNTNVNGGTYVAYLFAHNAGGFGLTGTDNVISCGTFSTNASGVRVQSLGYEPQWILIKRASGGTGDWYMFDTMRGWTVGGVDALLDANLSDLETSSLSYGNPTATGFETANLNGSTTFIYIAIRRGPMKVPTSGTSVFSPISSNASNGAPLTTGFPVDMQIQKFLAGSGDNFVIDRLRGVSTDPNSQQGNHLITNSTAAEASTYQLSKGWNSTGFLIPSIWANAQTLYLSFRRAPSFFDEVCYTGTGANRTVTHNLQAIPELIIFKKRSALEEWRVWSSSFSINDGLYLNRNYAKDTYGYDQTATPTSTTLSLGVGAYTNDSGSTYVAYLFATCAGVSKVGSYTGTGTTQQINCGFTGGSRFVLIKRTDSTGDWYFWDSARGIVAGNDPYLLLNSSAAQVTTTDYVDTYSAGFEISSTAPAAINASGGTFIFLAIA